MSWWRSTRKVKEFKLGSGDDVHLIESGDYHYIHDKESGCTITSNNHFGYIKNCYSHLQEEHDIAHKDPCVIHLGIGFGYDMLYVDSVLRKHTCNYRLVGVDLSDYGDMRVAVEKFNVKPEFHNVDVIRYLQGVKPQDFRDPACPEREVIILVDLFLKGNAPIDLVYESSLWKLITRNVAPDHIAVNRCGGPDTATVVQPVVGCHEYKKTMNLEFYHIQKNNTP